MSNLHLDFQSRISIRAIFAGTVFTFATLILLMTFGAALGFWNFKLSEISTLGGGFWTFAFLAWIVSIFLGSYVSAVAARSQSTIDGRLNALTAWASSCVFGCLFLAVATGSAFTSMNMGTPTSMYWGALIGDVLALAGSLLAGTLAARIYSDSPEYRKEKTESRKHRAEHANAV
jgi:magnesium-transporting ATPase (P-type)